MFEQLQAQLRPFILTNVVGPDFTSWWCDQVTKQMGPEPVYFIEGTATKDDRTVMQGKFDVFADEVGRLSSRDQYAYLQSELLPEKAPDLVGKLFQNMPNPLPVGSRSLFSEWPRGLSPSTMLLTVGGTGARTVLARDGLLAPQWHLCLTGHVRFKLLPDNPERLEPLRSKGEPFGIFDEHGKPVFDITLNLLSEIDLFATEMVDHSPLTELDSYGPDLHKWPETCLLPRALEVLLKPGEMLLVPGGWWMQAYCDEKSWIIGADYLDEMSLDRVLHGMLAYCKVLPNTIFALDCMPPKQRMDAVLGACLSSRCRADGGKVLADLRRMDREKAAAAGEAAAEAPAQKAGPCGVCGRPTKTVCGRCKGFRLCSAECQRRSWSDHQKVCVKVRS